MVNNTYCSLGYLALVNNWPNSQPSWICEK